MADKIRSIRIHGKGSSRYDNIRIGLNSRLDTLQAAILQVKFQAFVEYELDDVNKVARLYSERLKDTVKIPVIPEGYYSSWAQYTIQLESKEQRDALQEKLREQGIPTMIYYPKPVHRQSAFSYLKHPAGELSVTESLCDMVLSLPIHPYLDEKSIEEIWEAIEIIR